MKPRAARSMAASRRFTGRPQRFMAAKLKVTGKGRLLGPKSRRARLCRKMEAPMALISGTRGCAPRSGRKATRSRISPRTAAPARPAATATTKGTRPVARSITVTKAPPM